MEVSSRRIAHICPFMATFSVAASAMALHETFSLLPSFESGHCPTVEMIPAAQCSATSITKYWVLFYFHMAWYDDDDDGIRYLGEGGRWGGCVEVKHKISNAILHVIHYFPTCSENTEQVSTGQCPISTTAHRLYPGHSIYRIKNFLDTKPASYDWALIVMISY